MQRLVLLQAAPDDPEIAVLRLDTGDQEQLLQNPLTFINHYKVFCRDVSEVRMLPQPAPAAAETKTAKSAASATASFAIVVHYPSCVCRGFCVPASEPAPLVG